MSKLMSYRNLEALVHPLFKKKIYKDKSNRLERNRFHKDRHYQTEVNSAKNASDQTGSSKHASCSRVFRFHRSWAIHHG